MGAKTSKQKKQEPKVETKPETRRVYISQNDIIDPSDPTIFPEAVRRELMAVKDEIQPHELFKVKEFDSSSEFVKWLHQTRSYFEYEGENETNENNTNNTNNNNNKNNNNNTRRNTVSRDENRVNAFIQGLLASPPPPAPVSTNGYLSNTLAARLARLQQNRPQPTVRNLSHNALAMRLNRLRRIKEQEGGAGVERDKIPFMSRLYLMCDGADIREQFLANLLEVSNHFVIAFLQTGQIAGFSILGEERTDEGVCLHRYLTCTGPRRLGIGAGIVKAVHDIARREGYSCVTLGASASEGFHTKQGYVRTGKRTSEGPQMIYRLNGGRRRKTHRRRR